MRTERAGRSLLPVAAGAAVLLASWSPLDAQQPGGTGDDVAADSLADLIGVVASAETGKGIDGARITIPELDLAFASDGDGRFELRRVPPGTYDVRVQYLGYSTNERAVPVKPGRRTRVVFLLDRDVLEVADIQVEVRRTDRSAPRSAFRQRMREGRFGVFITREDIAKREPHNMTDMLREIPNVKVTPVEWGQATVFFRDGTGSVCEPMVFVDGNPAPGFHLDNLPPDAVEGIELYRRPSEMPVQFRGVGDADCGVLAVWSQTGELTSNR